MTEDKANFSNALWGLLENKDFDDITTVDIVRESGYSRASFYRYFKDKYELMLYSFDLFISSGLLGRLHADTPEKAAEYLLLLASENRRKILHALSSLDERALRRQVIERLSAYAEQRLKDTPSTNSNINTRSVGLLFSNSAIGMLIDWLSGNAHLTYAEIRVILTEWMNKLANIGSQNDDFARPDANALKNPIEEALFQMLESMSIDAIRIEAVVEQARVTRSSFYKQYRDKYDVVNRYFEKQAESRFTIRTSTRRIVVFTKDSVKAYLNHLLKNRIAVLNAVTTSDSCGLRPFATRYFEELIIESMSQQGAQNTKQLESVARMFCIGTVGHVIFWLKDPQQSTDEVYETIKLLYPAEIMANPNKRNGAALCENVGTNHE